MEVIRRSETITALAKSLCAAQGAMELAKRDATNPFFKSTYADLAAVVEVAKKPLFENGLCVVQTLIYCKLDNGGSQLALLSELLHQSGEWISGIYPINPTKNDPQGLGSAVTYARRYAYQALVGIAPAGEDDDGNKASGKETPPAREPAKKPETKPEPEPYKPPVRDPNAPSPIPENPWLWKIEGETIYKGKYIAALTDDVLKRLKKEKVRDDLYFKKLLTGLDMEALYECFRNQNARPDALSIIVDEEAAITAAETENQTNE